MVSFMISTESVRNILGTPSQISNKCTMYINNHLIHIALITCFGSISIPSQFPITPSHGKPYKQKLGQQEVGLQFQILLTV
jgi:hypothetical protein